jgi:hypothetical protein
MYRKIFNVAVIALTGVILISGCGGPGKKNPDEVQKPAFDSTKATLFQVGDELFSIPSPIQTALLIKQSGASFDNQILNDPKKINSYSTRAQKALNLGIYGADLGYVTIYDQTQEAINYLKVAKQIGEDLGVASAFSPELAKRFESNLGMRDSLLTLASEAYRASDAYLKNNEREDIGCLILAGGWIEALYFATYVAKASNNPEIHRRIAEQKVTLENMIKLAQRYSNREEFSDVVDNLIDLYYLFDEVEFSYTYEKPTTHPDKKLTVINSKSVVKMTPEQLNAITDKVQSIRNQIVG